MSWTCWPAGMLAINVVESIPCIGRRASDIFLPQQPQSVRWSVGGGGGATSKSAEIFFQSASYISRFNFSTKLLSSDVF
jgi:hypothetical protein